MTGEGGDRPRHEPQTDAGKAYEEALRERELRMYLLRACRNLAEKHAGTEQGEIVADIRDYLVQELSIRPGGRA